MYVCMRATQMSVIVGCTAELTYDCIVFIHRVCRRMHTYIQMWMYMLVVVWVVYNLQLFSNFFLNFEFCFWQFCVCVSTCTCVFNEIFFKTAKLVWKTEINVDTIFMCMHKDRMWPLGRMHLSSIIHKT